MANQVVFVFLKFVFPKFAFKPWLTCIVHRLSYISYSRTGLPGSNPTALAGVVLLLPLEETREISPLWKFATNAGCCRSNHRRSHHVQSFSVPAAQG